MSIVKTLTLMGLTILCLMIFVMCAAQVNIEFAEVVSLTNVKDVDSFVYLKSIATTALALFLGFISLCAALTMFNEIAPLNEFFKKEDEENK